MDTYRPSLSIRISAPDVAAGGSVDRWAKVDLEDHFWLGRCSICNLVVQGDQLVSRLHCTIQREGDVYRLSDMQSMNGTMVNGVSVRSTLLRPGDRIDMGETRILFTPSRPNDTLFEVNTSRPVGTATLTLRSFPTTIGGSRTIVPPTGATRVEGPLPPTSGGAAPRMPFKGDESLVDERLPVPPVFVPDQVPPLEEFLTIVIDRVVSELKAKLGVIHVPSIAGSNSVSIARGWAEGKLAELTVPDELAPRVEKVLPVAVLQPDRTFLEIGEVLQWQDGKMSRRIRPGERFPPHKGAGAEITVPLPRVGRMDPDLHVIRQHDAMAWIHVQLEPHSPESAYPRLVEVAGGMSASIIRYLERGR